MLGYTPHEIVGVKRKIICPVEDERFKDQLLILETLLGVESVIPILKPYKLINCEFNETDKIISVSNESVGGIKISLIVGPCSVESREQICETARLVKQAGANFLRGGVFKPLRNLFFRFIGPTIIKVGCN